MISPAGAWSSSTKHALRRVTIRGGGISANCCAHLLRRAGVQATIAPTLGPSVPAIMLSDMALGLMRDVFEQAEVFIDAPRINRRIVAWGGEAPVTLPHVAVVVSQKQLDAAFAPPANEEARADPSDFEIYTRSPLPAGEVSRFGNRLACATPVDLLQAEDQTACWIEACPDGWLFLIPSSPGAWLLAIGAETEELLAESVHIAPRVEMTGPASKPFDTTPRLSTALCSETWLACGTAAMAFDPICGDGSAQSVREAILAAAVIKGIAEGGDPTALLSHYDGMMIASMRRHVRMCADFYRSGYASPWWEQQLRDLADGFDALTVKLSTRPEPQFALEEFSLIPREMGE